MEDIYKNHTYIENNPNLHAEDSEFKYQNIITFLGSIKVEDKKIKILDIGGGAGVIGKLVLDFFQSRKIKVSFHSLDLSTKMLEIQKLNNPSIEKLMNIEIEKCLEKDYDLILMIDVIEHIQKKDETAEFLNTISKYIIYNIPIEINLFDYLKNITLLFKYYKNQKKVLGHVHFFTYKKAQDFLKTHHEIVTSYFKPYCFYLKESEYESYIKLKKIFFRNLEINLSCIIHKKLPKLSKYIIQGSNYSLVKTKSN